MEFRRVGVDCRPGWALRGILYPERSRQSYCHFPVIIAKGILTHNYVFFTISVRVSPALKNERTRPTEKEGAMQRSEPRELPFDSGAEAGWDRRDFITVCCMAAAAVGPPPAPGVKMAEAAARSQMRNV